ncbi:MAG: hypothetical protein M1831_004469 [Alyxoria varia]|nr:MAG: hypothetical protein M1831_004469 [Alyxoria varia]
MQMLFAIMSSSVAWTGPTKLSIVGFSLGAAISLDFITTYPWLIEAVVFLGPAGLLKKLPYDYERIVEMPSPLARSDARMRTMVEAILGVDTTMPMHRALASNGEDAIKQENVDQESLAEHSNSKDFDMGALLQWQYEFHEGHVYSFYNTVRNGPLMDCAPLWSKFGDLITGKAKSQPPCELSTAKVLVVFGDSDDVVVGPEVSEEILKKMPEGNVMFKYVAGGHGFVYPNSDQILEEIAFLWGL